MNAQQTEIYQRIQAFSLDEPDAIFPFSQRLASENGWTVQYTQRVINEYKKFIWLALTASHPVTPSVQVDQVWHLHLTYTHSYWDEFCAKTLQKALHHHPTRGGFSEQETFRKWYDETLISYEKFFGQPPPDDIWAPPVLRFSQMTKFRRINSQAYWFIPKPFFQISLMRSISVPNPFNLRLMMLAALSLLIAVIVGSVIPSITTATTAPLHFIDAQNVVAQVTKKTVASSTNTLKPWVSLWLTFLAFSVLSFILAVKLSFQKSYVYPGSKARLRVINKHELGVYVSFYIGFLCIIIPFLPKIITLLGKMVQDWNSLMILFFVILFQFFLILTFCIPGVLAEWACDFLAKLKKQKSIQLLYC